MSEAKILTKEFALPEVLGAITGFLLVDDGFSNIHELIEWIAGQPILCHQIPSIAPDIQRTLIKQFPQLNPETNSSLACDVQWLTGVLKDTRRWNRGDMIKHVWRKLKAEHGDSFHVAPMQAFDELNIALLIPDKAIVIVVSSDDFPENI